MLLLRSESIKTALNLEVSAKLLMTKVSCLMDNLAAQDLIPMKRTNLLKLY